MSELQWFLRESDACQPIPISHPEISFVEIRQEMERNLLSRLQIPAELLAETRAVSCTYQGIDAQVTENGQSERVS